MLTRHRVRDALLDNVELVASELVTNSLVCTRDPVSVRIMRTGGRLRLSVWDSSPYMPSERLRAGAGTGPRYRAGARPRALAATGMRRRVGPLPPRQRTP
ncbi:hypothetical protein ACIBCS_24920 [Streptomyces phaeochromogenes]|uniref:hypothetical protein n=1 Tax=Streptomyces phaeochromogenes TaxID=1923 RepID=UPI00378C1B96